MAFTIPEQYRVTEKIAQGLAFIGKGEMKVYISDVTWGANGYFFFPRQPNGKGSFFLVKSLHKDGWYSLAVNIPSEGRCATYEELHRIKRYFFEKEDVTFIMQPPGDGIYIGQKFWVHIWSPEDMRKMVMPPIFDHMKFEEMGFWRKFGKGLKSMFTINNNR